MWAKPLLLLLSLLLVVACSDSGSSKNNNRQTFADVVNCANGLSNTVNTGGHQFIRKDAALGLTAPHGFSRETWNIASGNRLQYTMFAGGVSAVYLDQDCWPDIILPVEMLME